MLENCDLLSEGIILQNHYEGRRRLLILFDRLDVLSFCSPLNMCVYVCVLWFLTLRAVIGSVPSQDDVLWAINTAKLINEQELTEYLTTSDGGDDSSAASVTCPMARYHRQGEWAHGAQSDKDTNNLIDAKSFLIHDGYTEDDLAYPNVTQTFLAQPGATCHGGTNTVIDCDPEVKYRHINGRCNNRQHIGWGSATGNQRRLLPAAYDDGFNLPRSKSVVYGTFLPNPRKVSNTVHIADRHAAYSSNMNLHVFQMGQFLENDIIETPVQSVIQDCCKRPVNFNYCMPIRILWYRDPNAFFMPGYCMNFQRSKVRFCTNETGCFKREQINLLTSFVDASNVYGSSESRLNAFRAAGGLLKVPEDTNPENNGICTTDVNKSVFCTIEDNKSTTVKSSGNNPLIFLGNPPKGTHNLNTVPTLIAYRTLFVREHNRIAEELRSSFPTDDDELFQETRRIVIAIMQTIIYDEFLPVFLPPRTISRFKLTTNYSYTYEPNTNPTASNEFGIAYRLGHTWIPKFMFFLNSDMYDEPTNDTYEMFDDTYYSGFNRTVDGFVTGILNETAPRTDRSIEGTARSYLFLDRKMNSYDLAALNIQRGRDHGIPSYTEYRKHCGLSGVEHFEQLVHHSADARARLKFVYSHVQDIDLYAGLLSETPMEGGEVGPTLACLLGQQFRRIKYGDRYWFQGEDVGLNSTQISAIRQYTFAKFLCNNLEITHVNYPNAFLTSDPMTSCDQIPQLDLTPFKTVKGG